MLCFILFSILFADIVVSNVIVGPGYSRIRDTTILGDGSISPTNEYLLRTRPGYMSPVPTQSDILQPINGNENLRTLNVKNSQWRANDGYLQPSGVKQFEVQNNPSLANPERVGSNRPLNVQSIPYSAETGNYGQLQTNYQFTSTPQNYNAEYINSNQRIRDILLSTNHRKRYLVVHPDGKVEHVDSLDLIAKEYPNFILINSDNIISNKPKEEIIIQPRTSFVTSVETETNLEPQNINSSTAQEISSNNSLNNDNILQQQVPSSSDDQLLEESSIITTDTTEESETSLVSSDEVPLTVVTATTINANPEDEVTFTTTNVPNVVFKSAGNNVVSTIEDSNSCADSSVENVSDVTADESENVITTDELEDEPDHKPVSWFKTDESIWDKLKDNTETQDVAYFFVVQSPHRIEKDTTRTVFANGTIVEELIESIWEHGFDSEPIVTKTVNVIQPDDIQD